MLNRYKVKVRKVIWSIVRKVTQQKRPVWQNPRLKSVSKFVNNIIWLVVIPCLLYFDLN